MRTSAALAVACAALIAGITLGIFVGTEVERARWMAADEAVEGVRLRAAAEMKSAHASDIQWVEADEYDRRTR